MGYRYDLSKLCLLEYILFFFSLVENRYMDYTPVLCVILTLRFVFAIKGYYFIIRNLISTRTANYIELLFLQLLYSFVIIISGIINGHITFGVCYSIFVWIGITNYVLYLGNTFLKCIRTIDIMFKLIVIITFILTAIIPSVMITHSYDGSRIIEGFFGGKNTLPPYILMGLSLNLIVYEIDRKRKLWRQYIYPLLCILLLFVSGSGTGSVIALAFLAFYFTKLYKLLNAYNIIAIHTIVFFSIVVFRLQEKFFYHFIVNTLHRDITLTGRSVIWSVAIKNFMSNWFVGFGLGNTVIEKNLVMPSWNTQIINETHNGILDIALSLGIMGLIPFLIFIIYVIRVYDKSESKHVSQALKLFVFLYFVIAISESEFTLSRLVFWSMLFIGLAVKNKNLNDRMLLFNKDGLHE